VRKTEGKDPLQRRGIRGLPALAAALACLLVANGVFAQVERLPSTQDNEASWEDLPRFDARRPAELPGEMPPGNLPLLVAPQGSAPYFPDEAALVGVEPAEILGPGAVLEADEEMPRGTRQGVFQKIAFNATWLAPGSGSGDFGMTDLELKTVLGFPCPTSKSPLVVSPGFGVHFFDGPTSVDLPGQVYDAYTQFRWLCRPSPRWGLDLGVTPGYYSDFQHASDRAVRITGYGAAMYTWQPNLKLVFGVAYLDRTDLNILPIGGLIWTPNADTSIELVVPRPRIARRLYCAGDSDDFEDWLYLAGEFGGGAWAIERASGLEDFITYHDYRIMVGVERKAFGQLSALVEVGYVFGRKLEFESPTPDIKPNDTVMVRAGVSY
jgi:hypothetical protein